MTAIMNGMTLHGGLIPYGGTFLMFSDYARNAVRMAALMQAAHDLRVHARFHRLGEDGPTHQPIEHLASLRAHSASERVAAVRCGGDRRRLDARPSSVATDPPRWC